MKTIVLKEKEIKETKEIKEKRKRLVVSTEKWIFDDLSLDSQYKMLDGLSESTDATQFILRQFNNKISSYKSQDGELFDKSVFVDLSFVIQRLRDCEMKCFYCRKPVMIVYDYAREPKQWTLERIDNAFGHNKNNVEIACLNCNLRRGCMYHERYIFTKQMVISKIDA